MLDLREDCTYVDSSVAIQVSKTNSEIMDINLGIWLSTKRAVHNSYRGGERWNFSALPICVAEHVDVPSWPIDHQDVAEAVAIPIAEVYRLAIVLCFENAAVG